MKEIQSYDGFEKALKDSSSLYINTEKIKTRIHEYAEFSCRKKSPQRLIVIIVSILVISLGTVAFGHVVNNVLLNKKGEKVFEYIGSDRVVSSPDSASSRDTKRINQLKDEFSKSVKHGEAGFLIITSEYKIDKYWTMFQDIKKLKNINDIINSTSTKFKLPLSDKISFKDGHIAFRSALENNPKDTYNSIARKYEEALSQNLDYIFWKEPLGKVADSIQLNYVINKPYEHGQYTIKNPYLNISISRSIGLLDPDNNPDKVSKIKIGEGEGLYIEENKPKIIIVDDSTGENLTYKFSFPYPELKDSVISIIESMK